MAFDTKREAKKFIDVDVEAPARPVGRPKKPVVPAPPARPLYDLSQFEPRPTDHCRLFPDKCRVQHHHDSADTPEQIALREAAKVELNRRCEARRAWAFSLVMRGATLPDWMATSEANNYLRDGASIARRGGTYNDQLHRWVDPTDDSSLVFNRELEDEIRSTQFGTVPDFRVRNGKVPDFAA